MKTWKVTLLNLEERRIAADSCYRDIHGTLTFCVRVQEENPTDPSVREIHAFASGVWKEVELVKT